MAHRVRQPADVLRVPHGESRISKRDDAIDLGATVLPVLVRTYWKQGVVALILLVLIIWLIARG